MYPSSGATIRGDLNTFVEEAAGADKFFIGPLVYPPFGVDVKSGTYPRLKKTSGALLKAGSTRREPKASYGEIDRAWEADTYDTLDRGLEELIDDTEQKDLARFFSQEQVTARLVLRAMMLDHEIRVAAKVFHATDWGTPTNSAVAYTAANSATNSFVADVLAAIERVNDNGESANTIVMSPDVFNRVRLATLTQNFVRGSRPTDSTLNITTGALQQAFAENGITQVLVGRARYDSAKKGQAFASAKVWGNTYVWVGDVKGGDFMAGGAGRTLVWNAEGGLFVTETYRNEQRRSGVIRVRQHAVEKTVNDGAGTLIATQYS